MNRYGKIYLSGKEKGTDMKYFIKANDAELGNATYVCETPEEMQQVWNELGDDVQLVYSTDNGRKIVLFERCW